VEAYYISMGFLLPAYSVHKVRGSLWALAQHNLGRSVRLRGHPMRPSEPANHATGPPPPQTYWMGLRSTLNGYPNFEWIDNTIPAIPLIMAPPPPPPDTGTIMDPVYPPKTYQNWGNLTLSNGTGVAEPNNLVSPPELCVACNYTQVSNVTWAWADASCGIQMPFMCRQTRGWPGCCRRDSSALQVSALAAPPVCFGSQPRCARGCSNTHFAPHSPDFCTPSSSPAAAPSNYSWVSPSTGLTYILSTHKKSWADAETFCQTQGGHLVAYSSSSQQRQVEQAFVGEGYLLPYFHAAYHVGLTQTTTWNYTNYFFRKTTYLPWDKNQPTGAGTCGVANTRTQRNGIYVFNDASCAVERPFICLVHSGWPAASCMQLPCCLLSPVCLLFPDRQRQDQRRVARVPICPQRPAPSPASTPTRPSTAMTCRPARCR
jgi:hypothetical protein